MHTRLQPYGPERGAVSKLKEWPGSRSGGLKDRAIFNASLRDAAGKDSRISEGPSLNSYGLTSDGVLKPGKNGVSVFSHGVTRCS